MNPTFLFRLLRRRQALLGRVNWSREQLEAHQAQSLAALRRHAYAHSPFYGRFHRGLEDRPLAELPVLSKGEMMANFDDFVTDRALRLADVDAFLSGFKDDERFLGRYFVNATSGSTGRRGVFVHDEDEWLTILASYARSYAWGGAMPGLTRRMRMAVVSTTTPWHQSALVGASVRSWFTPTLRLNASDPLPEIVARLNAWQPETLVTYASMVRLLAEEQLEGRLRIEPRAVFSASEVLTDQTRRRAREVWGREVFNVYGATETATIASECEHHVGMHLFEDLVITEIVDEHNRPVPPGEFGEKVLVTVLFSRTQPLIRYEMSDSVRASSAVCPSGWSFAMIDGIQGRLQEVLHLPAKAGGTVAIQPIVFHDVMDIVPVGGWQVVFRPDSLTVLLAGVSPGFSDEGLVRSLRGALEVRGAILPPVMVRHVETIPREVLGKAPLIKSEPALGNIAL